MRKSNRFLGVAGLTCVLGVLAAVFRSSYFRSGREAGGYLIPGHPMQILLWAMAAAMVLITAFFAWKLPKGIRRQPPMGLRTGTLQVLLAAAMALTIWNLPEDMRFYSILRILGWVVPAALLADGIMRCFQKKLGILSHSLLCIFLLIYIIDNYSRYWSNVPEMERILVPAVGLILLLPLSCEMAFWDLGKNGDRSLMVLGALAGFFCLAAIGGPGFQILHVGGAVWAINVLLSLGSGREG